MSRWMLMARKAELSRSGKGATAPRVRAHARRPRRIDAENHGLAAILGLVRAAETRSRHELERASGLGRAVVAGRLQTLSRLGLVREDALGAAAGGRAPRLARFRAEAGLLLVAVLDAAMIGVGVADLSGKLLIEHHEAADLAAGPQVTLKRLGTLFDWLLEQHRKDQQVWGIGIALPGPVETDTDQRFAFPPVHVLPSWNNFPFAEQLVLRYRAPVVLRGSVQMRTLGESRTGSGIGARDMLFMDLGREISAGVIADGALYRGTQGMAGMIGHVATSDDSRLICRCGNVGCLEAAAGAEAIVREALAAAKDGRSRHLADTLASATEITVADVGVAAQRGDPFSAEILSRCGRHIGAALAAAVNVLNPSLIVLGGEIAETGDILLAAIREAVYRRSHPLVTRDLRIVRSQMRNSAGLVGSALAMVDQFFTPDFVEGWVGSGTLLRHPEVEALVAFAETRVNGGKHQPKPPAGQILRAGNAA